MKLSVLAAAVPHVAQFGGDPEITGIAYDSRAAGPGTLFVALRGKLADGHDFIASAIFEGASAVFLETGRESAAKGIAYLATENTRKTLPAVASAFFGHPSRNLTMIGVTGTNGKTTTTYMLDSIFRGRGDKTGIIGTLGTIVDGKLELAPERTTPESPDLQRMLALMVERGVRVAAMEVSSEGTLQERSSSVAFDAGVFTNLTQDHLNTHGDMESYFAQKLRLFTEFPEAFPEKTFTAVVNGDDSYGRRVVDAVRAAGRKAVTFSVQDNADLSAVVHEATAVRTVFTLRARGAGETRIDLPIGGLFNVANALAASGAAMAVGASLDEVRNGLETMAGVPGRFEKIDTGSLGFDVVVDYAHTEDGLARLLRSARALSPKRIVCVFGCGGDRDPIKRPKMGRIAGELADVVVVTSDNPRTENPQSILEAVIAGIEGGRARHDLLVEVDRKKAIQTAIVELARPGDIVVIAGKGHEPYQIFADHTTHFDDREEAREAIALCS